MLSTESNKFISFDYDFEISEMYYQTFVQQSTTIFCDLNVLLRHKFDLLIHDNNPS